MIESLRWFDRTWVFNLPVGAFPAVLERLRGTPARADELVVGVPDEILSARTGASWSAKEHLGHLDDLHDLDEKRLNEFLARSDALSAADVTNRRTESADHNATSPERIVERLRRHREALVNRMENLSPDDVGVACLHPRLQQRMRLVDWAYFVAEHDDHHLVGARLAIRSASRRFSHSL